MNFRLGSAITCSIRGWHLVRGLDQELTLMALKRVLLDHLPEIHHSDQGVQYAATVYVDLSVDHSIAVSVTDRSEAWQNGCSERLVYIVKED